MTTSTAIPLRQDAQVIGLVGLAHGTSHFFHLSLAPLFPWLKDAFAVSYAELGLLMSVFFVVSGVGQALAGFVVDRFGALPVLLGGLLLLAFSVLGFAVSQDYAMLVCFAALAGLGNCVFHPADFTLLNRRVSLPRLGHAFSVHGLSGTVGWATAPVFLAGIATFAGWRVALASAAFVGFTVAALLFAFRHLLEPRELERIVTGPQHQAAAGGLRFLEIPAVWACFAFFLISSIAFGGVQSFAAIALIELYAMPIAFATSCITVYMLASASGILAGGFLASRIQGQDKVVTVAYTSAAAMSVFIAAAAVPAVAVMAMLAVVGFASGVAGPSRDLLVRAAAPKNATGRVYGVVYSGGDIGFSSAPLLFGLMMDAHHPGWVFIGIGAFMVLSLLVMLGVGGFAARQRAHAA